MVHNFMCNEVTITLYIHYSNLWTLKLRNNVYLCRENGIIPILYEYLGYLRSNNNCATIK